MSKEFVGKGSVSESFIYDEDESLADLESSLRYGGDISQEIGFEIAQDERHDNWSYSNGF